ncbi:MAG TPA: hypothetical protein VGN20_08925 [Mucilaginibacter sp.]|jgi:hypothetical protein
MTFTLGQFFPRKPVNEPELTLDDPKWKELEGGYKHTLYDASIALKQLEQAATLQSADIIYKELRDELHHQGDVGIASYYAVPHLVRIAKEKQMVDYNVLGLVSLIEILRHKNNPELPTKLKSAYHEAIMGLAELAQIAMKKEWNPSLASATLSALALVKNQHKLAEAIFNLDDEDVIDEFLKDHSLN